jgi:hypothetical protein
MPHTFHSRSQYAIASKISRGRVYSPSIFYAIGGFVGELGFYIVEFETSGYLLSISQVVKIKRVDTCDNIKKNFQLSLKTHRQGVFFHLISLTLVHCISLHKVHEMIVETMASS